MKMTGRKLIIVAIIYFFVDILYRRFISGETRMELFEFQYFILNFTFKLFTLLLFLSIIFQGPVLKIIKLLIVVLFIYICVSVYSYIDRPAGTNFNPFKLIIPTVFKYLIYFLFFALLFAGPFLKMIMRLLEKRFFKADSQYEFQLKEPNFPTIPFLNVFLLNFFIHSILFFFIVIVFHSYLNNNILETISIFFGLIIAISFGYAIVIHLQPNSIRKKKYNILLFGVLILHSFAFVQQVEKLISYNSSSNERAIFTITWLFVNIIFNLFFLIIGILFNKYIKNILAKNLNYPHPIIQKFYGFIRFLWLIMFALPLLGIYIYLLLRYLLTEYMQMFPIVYLRSFHYNESSEVFANLIAPEASKFGVIVGLVHEKQKGSDIFARTHIANQGQTFTISDEFWQDWVKDKLSRCSVVIIDGSVGSESISWEILTSNKLVDPNRIIVLHKAGTEQEISSGNKQLVYALDEKSLKEARKSFKKILKDIFSMPSEQKKEE
jgi:hypothetical protein